SPSKHLKFQAMWTEVDVCMLINYVEESQSKAGNCMSFQEGHFNDLLPQLPVQPNGHHKTSKNCHDKWESMHLFTLSSYSHHSYHTKLKWEYYAASTIASGLGPAYLAEKGANIVTEAGQLVMDDLVETQPDIGQFQSKGFKYLEHMQQFVPPSKAKGAN
ncbi:hypothetical protein V8B97DRAFT_1843186, partial [Scleroderma yunnanense]